MGNHQKTTKPPIWLQTSLKGKADLPGHCTSLRKWPTPHGYSQWPRLHVSLWLISSISTFLPLIFSSFVLNPFIEESTRLTTSPPDVPDVPDRLDRLSSMALMASIACAFGRRPPLPAFGARPRLHAVLHRDAAGRALRALRGAGNGATGKSPCGIGIVFL